MNEILHKCPYTNGVFYYHVHEETIPEILLLFFFIEPILHLFCQRELCPCFVRKITDMEVATKLWQRTQNLFRLVHNMIDCLLVLFHFRYCFLCVPLTHPRDSITTTFPLTLTLSLNSSLCFWFDLIWFVLL